MTNINLKQLTATSVRTDDGTIICRYHDTDIAKYNPTTRTVTLNSGGWHTATTKRHINQCFQVWGLPFHLFQSARQWYVSRHIGNGWEDTAVSFKDNMTLETRAS